jgi:hypothetical protein
MPNGILRPLASRQRMAIFPVLVFIAFFYRIVGKYSSHRPSRAGEDRDGFGWW